MIAALILATAIGMASSASTLAVPPPPELSLAGEGELEAKGRDDDTAEAELVVVNPGYAVPIGLEFVSVKNAGAEIARYKPKLIRAKGATPVKVTFSGISSMKSGDEGVVVVKGGASPLVREVKVTRGLHPWLGLDWPVVLVVGAFVAMLALFGGIVLFANAFTTESHLTGKAPGPKWSFSSWATTLTAVGALLGTVVTAAAYPPEPSQITKETLFAMGLLFGALVVVGPFVFQAIRDPKADTNNQSALWGYNLALLASCAITAGAVLGELGCFALLTRELVPHDGWWFGALVAIVLIFGLAVYYFSVTAWHLVKTDWEAEVEKEATPKPIPVYVVVNGTDSQGNQEFRDPLSGKTFDFSSAEVAGEIHVPAAAPPAMSWNLP